MLLLLVFSFPWSHDSSPAGTDLYPQPSVPTLDFCELVKHPRQFFDRPIIRITATFEFGDEGARIFDVRCLRSHRDQIGVDSISPDKQATSLPDDLSTLHSGRFGEQPRVTMTGILRHLSRRDFQGYRYRFDIISLEKMVRAPAEEINSYSGALQAGLTYRGTVRPDRDFGLSFESTLRLAAHQAVRLEWTNREQFPRLQRMRRTDRRQIVFRVVSDQVRQMSLERWNRTLKLEIRLVE